MIAHLLSRREDMEVVTPVWYEGFVHGFPLEEVSEEVNRQLASCIRIFLIECREKDILLRFCGKRTQRGGQEWCKGSR